MTLQEKLRSAFSDLDLLRSGWRPDASIDAIPLDNWLPLTHRGLDLPALAGDADHPRLGLSLITTSPVLWISDDCRFRRDRPGNPIINRPLFRELTGRDSENYPARAGVGSGSCFWMS